MLAGLNVVVRKKSVAWRYPREDLSHVGPDHPVDCPPVQGPFEGVAKSFADRERLREWRTFFTAASLREAPWPPVADRVSALGRLCLVRTLRPDWLPLAVADYVQTNRELGPAFTQPPPFDLMAAFRDSSNQTPIVFILSSGADPRQLLYDFAARMKPPRKVNQPASQPLPHFDHTTCAPQSPGQAEQPKGPGTQLSIKHVLALRRSTMIRNARPDGVHA